MEQEIQRWYAMRDLKRSNAKMRAYEMLQGKVMRVYTPMIKKDIVIKGKHNLIDVPYIPDLLFVYDYKSAIDPIVDSVPTFQYRFARNGTYIDGLGKCIVVSDREMEQFIRVTQGIEKFRYYTIDEVSPSMYGRKICIVGGSLDGCVGQIEDKAWLKVQGTDNRDARHPCRRRSGESGIYPFYRLSGCVVY